MDFKKNRSRITFAFNVFLDGQIGGGVSKLNINTHNNIPPRA